MLLLFISNDSNKVRMLVHFFCHTGHAVCGDLNSDADVEHWPEHKVISVVGTEMIYSRHIEELRAVYQIYSVRSWHNRVNKSRKWIEMGIVRAIFFACILALVCKVNVTPFVSELNVKKPDSG